MGGKTSVFQSSFNLDVFPGMHNDDCDYQCVINVGVESIITPWLVGTP